MLKKRRCKENLDVEQNQMKPQYIMEPNNLDLMNKMHRLETLYIQMMTGIDGLHDELDKINQQIDNIKHDGEEDNIRMDDYSDDEDELNSYFS